MFFPTSITVLVASLLFQTAIAASSSDTGLSDARASHTHTPSFGLSSSYIIGQGAPTLALTADSAAVTPKGPAPIGPNPVVVALHTITHASSTLNVDLAKVTAQLSVSEITAAVAVTVHTLADIVADIASVIRVLQTRPVIGGAFVDIVVEGLVRFVKVHQALLNTVIAKHSIFAQFALTAPLAAVLRALEAAVDVFASALIRAIPSKKAIIQKQLSGLDDAFQASISTYSQVCSPSTMFPKTQPPCIKYSSQIHGH